MRNAINRIHARQARLLLQVLLILLRLLHFFFPNLVSFARHGLRLNVEPQWKAAPKLTNLLIPNHRAIL